MCLMENSVMWKKAWIWGIASGLYLKYTCFSSTLFFLFLLPPGELQYNYDANYPELALDPIS